MKLATGIAAAVREHLRDRGPHGATPREIRDATEHGLNGISTALSNMRKVGKVDYRGGRYFANAQTFVDGRGRKTSAQLRVRKAEVAQACRPASPAPSTAPLSIARAFAPTLAVPQPGIAARQPMRDALASDVEAFLAAGGEIQHLRQGDTAESVRERETRTCREYGRHSEIPTTRRRTRAA